MNLPHASKQYTAKRSPGRRMKLGLHEALPECGIAGQEGSARSLAGSGDASLETENVAEC